MCTGCSPAAGPPIQLPLGQTLTQAKPRPQPSVAQNQNPTDLTPPPPNGTRGHNLNISA